MITEAIKLINVPEAGQSIVVTDDGRQWAIVAAEPLPAYMGHRRTAREPLAGFWVYPFTKRETAEKVALHIARDMGRKVTVNA